MMKSDMSDLPTYPQLRRETELEIERTIAEMAYKTTREDALFRMFVAYRESVLCNGWPDVQRGDSCPRSSGCALAVKDLADAKQHLSSGALEFLRPSSTTQES